MSRLKPGLVALALAPALTGCVIYSGEGGDNVVVRVADAVPRPETETLRAARFENGALIARVDSNGCTSAASFAVELEGDSPVEATLVRQSPDLCKALVPDGVEVRWTYADLGLSAGQAVRLINPVKLP